MKIKNAVICAAGLGSRLGLDLPKCLVDIGDHKLIYYLLELLEDVENVRIVVGFKEEQVMKYVKNIRKDVVFVRNPEYMRTSNAYSLYLGTHDLKDSYLTIDGDMIIEKKSFQSFVDACQPNQNLLGIAKAKTEDAVFVETNDNQEVVAFSRKRIGDNEWAGIAHFTSVKIRKEGNYIFEELLPHLPLKAQVIECFEIDTPDDLEKAYKEISFL